MECRRSGKEKIRFARIHGRCLCCRCRRRQPRKLAQKRLMKIGDGEFNLWFLTGKLLVASKYQIISGEPGALGVGTNEGVIVTNCLMMV